MRRRYVNLHFTRNNKRSKRPTRVYNKRRGPSDQRPWNDRGYNNFLDALYEKHRDPE